MKTLKVNVSHTRYSNPTTAPEKIEVPRESQMTPSPQSIDVNQEWFYRKAFYDLKTPLAILQLQLQLALSKRLGNPPEELGKALCGMKRQVDSMTGLLSDIQDGVGTFRFSSGYSDSLRLGAMQSKKDCED